MDGNTVFNLAGIFAISVIGSLVVLWIFGAVLGSGRRSKGAPASQAITENTILFRNGVIDDHDLNALSALGTVEDWNDLRAWLSDRFADLPEYLPDDQTQTSTYHTHDRINDEATVTIAASKGMTCVTLVDPIECQPVDRHQAHAPQDRAGRRSPCADDRPLRDLEDQHRRGGDLAQRGLHPLAGRATGPCHGECRDP